MFESKKEKKVRQMVDEHIARTRECLDAAVQAVGRYLAGDLEATEQLSERASELERKADTLRREIYKWLGMGAFLPILRADIHELVGEMDDLAGMADNMSEAAVVEKPFLPERYHGEIRKIMDSTIMQVEILQKTVQSVFGSSRLDKKEIGMLIQKIEDYEHAVDDIEWQLTRTLFESDLNLAQKMHFKRFLDRLTVISDKAEDISDTLGELVVKFEV